MCRTSKRIEAESRPVFTYGCGEGEVETLLFGGEDGNVDLDSGDGYTACNYTKIM